MSEDIGWRKYYDDINVYADRMTSIHGLEGWTIWNIEESPYGNLKFKKALIFWWGSYDCKKPLDSKED